VLRTVSPSVVLSRWEGRSDRASVGALAKRTGAGMAIIGNLAPHGTDSVVVSATLVDTRADRMITETAVSGTTQHLGELIEQLGRALLDGLSRERPVGAVRQIAMSRAPLPALKAFLRGEQFYRRIGYDSALAAYAEAVAGDSGFTMAYYRMHQVLDWNPPTMGRYAGNEWYSGQAHRRNRGLSERDSLLVRIDSIFTSDGSVATFHLAQQELDAAVSRFPGDPEIWTAYGELWFHASDAAAPDRPQRALAAFDRAIAADSSFLPAYEHTLALTAMLGGRDRTLPYARALARLLPPGSSISAVSLEGRLLLAPDSERPRIVASVAPAAGATELFTSVLEISRWIPDSAETAVLLARALARRSLLPVDAPPWVVDSLMRLHYLALTLASRGHLSEAVRADSAMLEDPGRVSWSWFLPLASDLAYLGALAPAAVLPALRPEPVLDKRIVTAPYLTATQRSLGAAAWWDRRGDTTALSSHARSLQRAQAGKQNPSGAARLAYAEAVLRGYLALARGDTSAALQSFGQQPSTVCDGDLSCSAEIARVVDVLVAQGKRARAAELLDYLIVSHFGPRSVLFRLARGHLAEQLGDTAGAVRAYRYVVDAWRNADRVLQPNVTDARAGLVRLGPR
jgi:tetratricopeptide (TPR) repeat protein